MQVKKIIIHTVEIKLLKQRTCCHICANVALFRLDIEQPKNYTLHHYSLRETSIIVELLNFAVAQFHGIFFGTSHPRISILHKLIKKRYRVIFPNVGNKLTHKIMSLRGSEI